MPRLDIKATRHEDVVNLLVFTKSEAALYLRVSVMTINNLMTRGQLKYAKLGRSVRFNRADLDAVLAPKAAA